MAHDPNAFEIDAMLCDSAVAAEGKLYLQGAGWENLNTPALPFAVPRIGVALVISVPYSRTNENFNLTLKMIGQDSDAPIPLGPPMQDDQGNTKQPVMIGAQFTVGRPATLARGDSQVVCMAMNLDQMVFTDAGLYSFLIAINDEEVKRLHFRVLVPTVLNIR